MPLRPTLRLSSAALVPSVYLAIREADLAVVAATIVPAGTDRPAEVGRYSLAIALSEPGTAMYVRCGAQYAPDVASLEDAAAPLPLTHDPAAH